MSTTRTPMNEGPRLYRSRWFMPAFCLFLAVLIFGAFAIGGDAGTGLQSAAIMVLLGAVFLFGSRRSETLAGLGGPGRDERWHAIDVTATAMTGAVLVVTVIGCWLYEVAQGRDGMPYAALGAVGGVAYVLAVALLRWRS
jgi:hypothetical protein